PPAIWSHLPSPNITFCVSSCRRDGTSSGRSPTSRDCSAARAARFADRTAANVATARTSVPAAVASDAIDAQSVEFTDCRLVHGGGHAGASTGRLPGGHGPAEWRRTGNSPLGWASSGTYTYASGAGRPVLSSRFRGYVRGSLGRRLTVSVS